MNLISFLDAARRRNRLRIIISNEPSRLAKFKSFGVPTRRVTVLAIKPSIEFVIFVGAKLSYFLLIGICLLDLVIRFKPCRAIESAKRKKCLTTNVLKGRADND